LDLGKSPIANNLAVSKEMSSIDNKYSLCAMTCENCGLVQLSESISREKLFTPDYVYYSSFSSSLLEHSRVYAQKMIDLLSLSEKDLVIEVASNDGYLLQFFAAHKIPVLGIEPSTGVAESAKKRLIPTIIDFFGEKLAMDLSKKQKPKLLIGNNVLAHVPNLFDFVKGFSILIAEGGIITFEFPHLLNLIKKNQFDTIYHEHYSYLSITALLPIFDANELKVVDVQKIETHGGSLRVFLAKKTSTWPIDESVAKIIKEESIYDPRKKEVYSFFQEQVFRIRDDLITELKDCKNNGLRIAAYGAAAKGVTLLNFCRIDSTVIEYVVDINPNKQGKFLPISQIPIVNQEFLALNPPDILLVLAWNLSEEIKIQLFNQAENGMKFIRAIPKVEYF
jgi:2-polyprenyl-3-methyl-5-hydroxy-6-metoxy-1,4-benzoquinol methylase